jgi:hypothetical protein
MYPWLPLPDKGGGSLFYPNPETEKGGQNRQCRKSV